MAGRFPSSLLEFYPHMGVEDVRIWELWLRENLDAYESYDYDVKVGTGRRVPPGVPPEFHAMIIHNSKFRIDAVGYRDGAVMLFEVKPDVSISGYGQYAVYTRLFAQDFPELELLGMTFVFERIHPDIEEMLLDEGVILAQVDEPTLDVDVDTGDIIPFDEESDLDEFL